jgi:flap endonuclease-1
MGVNLSELVSREQIGIESLNGKTIAIDAYNALYQFLSIIRDRFTGEPLRDSKGRVTSHLSGLFYRTTRLLENGIDPVFVFDGTPPKFKKATSEMRQAVKKDAEEKLEEARERGDREAIRRYAQATSRLTDEMIEHSKSLLEYMGIPVIQAPSEGEAMCAYLCKTGKVYSAASQDFDSLAFGSPRVIRNLAITGKRKLPRKQAYIEVKPEIIDLENVLNQLGINQDQLIIIGILIGTDYNPGGVKGIGPKGALKLVKERGEFDRIFSDVRWEFYVEPKEIFEFFRNPPSRECGIERVKPDFTKLKEFMMDFDFSEERVGKTIERLENTKKSRQDGLHKWLR